LVSLTPDPVSVADRVTVTSEAYQSLFPCVPEREMAVSGEELSTVKTPSVVISKPPKELTSFWVRDYTATQKGTSYLFALLLPGGCSEDVGISCLKGQIF